MNSTFTFNTLTHLLSQHQSGMGRGIQLWRFPSTVGWRAHLQVHLCCWLPALSQPEQHQQKCHWYHQLATGGEGEGEGERGREGRGERERSVNTNTPRTLLTSGCAAVAGMLSHNHTKCWDRQDQWVSWPADLLTQAAHISSAFQHQNPPLSGRWLQGTWSSWG